MENCGVKEIPKLCWGERAMKLYAMSDLYGSLDGLDPKGADLVSIAGGVAPRVRRYFIGFCN